MLKLVLKREAGSMALPLRGRAAKRAALLTFISMLGLIFLSSPAFAAWESPNISTPQMAAAAPGVTATISAPNSNAYFTINADDIAAEVANQLRLQAIQPKAEVALAAGLPKVIYSADHPLKLALHALQIDPNSHRWQAQANILAGNKTETVKPISGTYIPLVDVPVVTRQLGHSDVIEAKDITTRAVREQEVRKETALDMKQLIGKSPRAGISPNRPIRLSELAMPAVIKRGDAVQMNYTNAYMSIRATGSALQDGAVGELIRVKNDKSGKAVSGRVTGSGAIEVNQAQ